MLIYVPSGSFHQALPGLRCRNAFVQALRVSAPGCTKEQYNTEGLAKLLLFLTVVVLKRHKWQGNRRDASNDPASRRCARRAIMAMMIARRGGGDYRGPCSD